MRLPFEESDRVVVLVADADALGEPRLPAGLDRLKPHREKSADVLRAVVEVLPAQFPRALLGAREGLVPQPAFGFGPLLFFAILVVSLFVAVRRRDLRLAVFLKKVVESFSEKSLHGRAAFHGKFA